MKEFKDLVGIEDDKIEFKDGIKKETLKMKEFKDLVGIEDDKIEFKEGFEHDEEDK